MSEEIRLDNKNKNVEDFVKQPVIIHYLKIWPEYFECVKKGLKTFELRENDRDFNEGDILCLSEWDDKLEQYTSKKLFCKITYILKGPSFGLSKEYCIMSIKVELFSNTIINENWIKKTIG